MNLSSGYPFWLIRHGLPYDYPKLQEDLETDVLIIGGGISGALVSYCLTQAGVDNVVADARTIGLGSTCASTSLLQYEIDTPLCRLQHITGLKNAVRIYRLCYESIDKLEAIAKKIKFPEFQRVSSIYYAAFKKDTAFIEEEFKIREVHGFDVVLLQPEQIRERFGFDAPIAILSAQGAQTNAYSFTHALHQYSIRKGAKIFGRTEIVKITHKKNRVTAKTKTHTIKARKIVYATGYESVKYIKEKIADLHSTYAVCSEQRNNGEAPYKNGTMMWNTADPYLYMRTTEDNRILIGGRDEKFYNPFKRDKLLPKKTKQLVRDFGKLYPDVPFKPEFSWAGTFGSTKDGLPLIGQYKKLPNGYFALGFGGNGITFSLIAAEILSDLLQEKQNKDAKLFSFDRT
jgi:glycine/D-amino acid oxidase-like deaminating enzyme